MVFYLFAEISLLGKLCFIIKVCHRGFENIMLFIGIFRRLVIGEMVLFINLLSFDKF
jgi:hypothetical protein